MNLTVLHGFSDDGRLLVWVRQLGGILNDSYVIKICVSGNVVFEAEVQLHPEAIHRSPIVGIGTLVIPDFASLSKGCTADLSILLCKDGRQIRDPIPFVVSPTN